MVDLLKQEAGGGDFLWCLGLGSHSGEGNGPGTWVGAPAGCGFSAKMELVEDVCILVASSRRWASLWTMVCLYDGYCH